MVLCYFDIFDNFVCCVVGWCEFILFLFVQIDNFYLGLFDFMLGGQVVSVVDFECFDFDWYLCFCEVLVYVCSVVFGFGDVIFIFSMWWYYVCSLELFNVLVNYWW